MRRQRVTVVFALLMLGFGGIFVRLVDLQLVEHEIWSFESQRSARRFESVPFERGWILDRNGEPLARTEEVRDLTFRLRRWRKGTVAGAAAAALHLLDGHRRSCRVAYERVDDHLARLAALPVAVFAELQPRQRSRDLRYYVGRLFGAELEDALFERLADGDVRGELVLADVAGCRRGWEAAHHRALAERAALDDLAYQARLTPHAVWEQMDEAIAATDARVRRLLDAEARRTEDGVVPEGAATLAALAARFDRERQLHAEFDDDATLVASAVPYDAETLVAIRGSQLAGFEVRTERRRTYPPEVADIAPLVVGRVGLPGPEDIERAEANRLRLADLAALESLTPEELAEYERLRLLVREIDYTYTDERGVLGLEQAFEQVLRGKRGWIARSEGPDGEHDVEVDWAPSQRGLNVTLTLDLDLQRAAQRVLDRFLEPGVVDGTSTVGAPGAIVMLEARTGRIRALATSPRPTRAALADDYGALLADPRGPLLHRAIGPGSTGNLPPPGSTFKPVVALAGLHHGVLDPHEELLCERRLEVGTTQLSCLFTHGAIGLERALGKSCNVYFYKLADRIGGERLLDYARGLGFGEPARLLRDNEVLADFGIPVGAGLRERWVPLTDTRLSRTETMRLGIGQAPLDDTSPLEVATMMAALATGEYRPPSLVASVEGFGTLPPRAARPLPARRSHLDAVRAGLEAVLDSGTAATKIDRLALSELGFDVAGKTGTPEVDGRLDHSWFAGYFPRRDPLVAFAIFLEHTGEHGGDAGVPVFNALLADEGFRFFLERELRP